MSARNLVACVRTQRFCVQFCGLTHLFSQYAGKVHQIARTSMMMCDYVPHSGLNQAWISARTSTLKRFSSLTALFDCLFPQVSGRGGNRRVVSSRCRRTPLCRTACKQRMPPESESGLAALRLASPSRGMTALWCSLWLSFLLPLCVAPARLPTAQPTGTTPPTCM